MKKILISATLLGLSIPVFAASASCSTTLSNMATVAQQQVAVSKQIEQTIDNYKFIPEQQRTVFKRDAGIMSKNAEKNVNTLKTMAANKQIGEDGCVGMGNDTIGMMNNTVAINKALITSAQAVQNQREAIIQKSQCGDEASCNKVLYQHFGAILEPVLQKNLGEMSARAQKMGLIQPTTPKASTPVDPTR